MGLTYHYPENPNYKDANAKKLEEYLTKNSEWYIIYDFIEVYLNYLNNDTEKQRRVSNDFNNILESEVSAYRIVDNIVVPIVDEIEIKTIEKSMNTKFENVNIHFSKALKLYSDRKNPDYENSIKESISAVEAMCCIITGESGKSATLCKTIKKLKQKGINIHGSMEAAISNLYGYTSDEDGIRHGGIDFKNAPSEDAKYMLVSCSAFVNYLIEKLSKIQ
jgi:signal recognition particle GTPase